MTARKCSTSRASDTRVVSPHKAICGPKMGHYEGMRKVKIITVPEN